MDKAVNDERKEDFSDTAIDVLEQDILDVSPFLLDLLLQDKTTGENIIWACDDYIGYGSEYAAEKEILPALITGANTTIIQPRIAKDKEAQRNRTRKSAEVFTPSWICRLMNDLCDEEWFGRKNVFNIPTGDDRDWTPTASPVEFEQGKGKTPAWTRYVDSKRLEITCGEAPYLVSRYDTTTGEFLPIEKRIGVLDRKLRIVGENAESETEWFFWARRAYESTYGYEFQGDNLLLARENLLFTFGDYYTAKFQKAAPLTLLKQIANIIAWNIWQMDGLKDCVPFRAEQCPQLDLFADIPSFAEQTDCVIKDWRSKKILKFKEMKGINTMKFDFCVGNPPYQEETAIKETANGQKRRRSIFQYLQIEADKISNIGSVLIYPAIRWIHRSGKGMEEFGMNQINDPHLSDLIVYADAKDVFKESEIADGISIVSKRKSKADTEFKYTYNYKGESFCSIQQAPREEILPIHPKDSALVKKTSEFVEAKKLRYLSESILSQKLFGIESDFVEKNPEKVTLLTSNTKIDYSKKIKLLTNDKAGKAGRSTWFLADKNSVSSNPKLIYEWQVVVSSANAGGQKRDNQLEIIDNHSAFGRSRVALKSFKTEEEAKNFYNYAKSYVIRYAFLMTDENLTSLAKRVPDILNYKTDNELIDFKKDIDEQLCRLIGLTNEEYQYLVNRVNTFRNGGKA